MRVSTHIRCESFPCNDAVHSSYLIPNVDIDPQAVSIMLISESAPASLADHYYAEGDPLFQQTTVRAFKDAGIDVDSVPDILNLGVYLTPAVKCGKSDYAIKTGTIETCSHLLEQELALFPNVKALLLMGDVAIKAVNAIARRSGLPRVIPAESTYKIRGRSFFYKRLRAFPSYLQAGPSFFIEKVKRKAIAEDIAAAFNWVQQSGA
ncbi:MAG TPA: uracil-DNA glycosylase [Anaerolineaceae bacterium]|nr:uracil-DNA glycosylase [Anaerolineaceae bacterium]HPN52157.1 uracil-DNA glycosylase [Anaerolineaceae bacterium]